jgi:Pectinacetylesterase
MSTVAGDGWERVEPRGDCECADGSEFAFWERPADPTRVVFFLDGGICTDAEGCAFIGLSAGGREASYDWSVWGEDPAHDGGIFDLARADNPFRDFSFVDVPSCTGDLHLGDTTHEHSPELTVEHNGDVNGTETLAYLAEHDPDAEQVVVVGKSAGSVAAPIYGGLAADLLPDAQVTVLGADVKAGRLAIRLIHARAGSRGRSCRAPRRRSRGGCTALRRVRTPRRSSTSSRPPWQVVRDRR